MVARANCKACGAKTTSVLWAGKHLRFTLLFDAFAIGVIQACGIVKSAPELIGLDWDSVHWIGFDDIGIGRQGPPGRKMRRDASWHAIRAAAARASSRSAGRSAMREREDVRAEIPSPRSAARRRRIVAAPRSACDDCEWRR